MAKHGKRYLEARAKVDREKLYSPGEAVRLLKETKGTKYDESVEVHVRTGLNVRHADEQLRGTIALPARPRQERHDRRLRQGRQGARGRGGRRRLRRRRGPRRAHPGRGLHRLRRRDRDAGHDARRRPPRPHPRPAGQDAEPEGRHGHDGRRQGRRGVQGRQGRVPHRPHRDRPHGRRQDLVQRRAAARQLPGDPRGADPGEAVGRQGPLHPLDRHRVVDGPRHQGRPVEDQGPDRRKQ